MISFIDHPDGSLTVTDGNHRTQFNPAEVVALAAHLATRHGCAFAPPTCAECGVELAEGEAGDAVCLDCALVY